MKPQINVLFVKENYEIQIHDPNGIAISTTLKIARLMTEVFLQQVEALKLRFINKGRRRNKIKP